MGGHFDSITLVNKPQQRLETWLRIDLEFKMVARKSKLREPVWPHSMYIVTYMTEAHRTMISFFT